MKTQWTTRVRLCALAAAGMALAGVNAPALADSQQDRRPVTALNGWNGRMGPGVGSVKTPFLVVEIAQPLNAGLDDTMYFHTSTGQPVQQVPTTRMGPGLWSSKSPFSGRGDSSTPQ